MEISGFLDSFIAGLVVAILPAFLTFLALPFAVRAKDRQMLRGLGIDDSVSKIWILLSEIHVVESMGRDSLSHSFTGNAVPLIEYDAAVTLADLITQPSAVSKVWNVSPERFRPAFVRRPDVEITSSGAIENVGEDEAIICLGSDVYNWYTHKVFNSSEPQISKNLLRFVLVHSETGVPIENPKQDGELALRLDRSMYPDGRNTPRVRDVLLPGGDDRRIMIRDFMVEKPGFTRDGAIIQTVETSGLDKFPKSLLLISGLGGTGTHAAVLFLKRKIESRRAVGRRALRGRGPHQLGLVLAWFVKCPNPDFDEPLPDVNSVGVLHPKGYYDDLPAGRPEHVPAKQWDGSLRRF